MVNLGSLLNMMSLSTLEEMEIPRDRIVKQPVGVPAFGGNASFTLGFVSLVQLSGLCKQPIVSMLLMLGPQAQNCLPHVSLQAIWKGKKVHVNVSESPFQQDEAQFSGSGFFDELAEACEIVPAHPRGLPLSIWEVPRSKNQSLIILPLYPPVLRPLK